jgi:hypothetical protein
MQKKQSRKQSRRVIDPALLLRVVLLLLRDVLLSGWSGQGLAVGGAQNTKSRVATVHACPALRFQN